MKTWRYIATKVLDANTKTESWEIRELYPDENGKFSYTASAVLPYGETFAELFADLSHMVKDSTGPWLDLTGEEPRLINAEPK